MPSKYKIFIIFHDTLNIKYYNESILENLIFVNVKKNNKNNYPDLNIINLHDFKDYIPIGKYYAESEVLYNVYKNSSLVENVKYIGFLHHDIDCSPLTNEIIQELIEFNKLISFETHSFKTDYDKNILMDIKKPNILHGKGTNCYDAIFLDFNSFYSTQHLIKDFYNSNKKIILCSCFLTSKDIFFELMEFSSVIIESQRLNVFDTKHQYRLQGGLMERYYAIWFLLKGIPFVSFKLCHNFYESKKENTLIKRILRKIKSLL